MMNEAEERIWQQGYNAFAARVLRLSLGTLQGASKTEVQWTLERAEVVAKLREICGEYGDNKWEDDLHLVDVLEKHLLQHLDADADATDERIAALEALGPEDFDPGYGGTH